MSTEVGTGDLFEADVEAVVNTVNVFGVAGKGIALAFRQEFPENYEAYKAACDRKEVKPGGMFVFERSGEENPRFIVNFPTKRHWREASRLEDIEEGLADLVRVIRERSIRSIAVPALGCGLGGLDWNVVEPLIVSALGPLEGVRVVLFPPQEKHS